MAGTKFQYDESGSTFYYFILCFLGFILSPCTYYYFIKKEDKSSDVTGECLCSCAGCSQKKNILKQSQPKRVWKRRFVQLLILFGWSVFALHIYKVQQFDYEYATFDPYDILKVSLGASKSDIKRAYKRLSLTEHPDKGGDEKEFVKMTKAYQALTDDTARRNWELYGNPDGPSVMNFGIALPVWIVEKENSLWVLGAYTLVFIVALPVVVGTWWYNAMKYSSDQVLLDTTQLYYYFIHKTPHMMLRRLIMLLAASLEYEHGHNSDIVVRASDNFEVPLLMKQLPNLGENNKERPLCFEYSIKARCLLHAHLTRIPLPPATLELDRQIILRKVPFLIQEMVQCFSQMTMLAFAGRIQFMPHLDTLENTFKLSAMLVQGMWECKSPFYQLPYITEAVLKCFHDKKNKLSVKTLQNLASLSSKDRNYVLRFLSDTQITHINSILSRMPDISFDVISEVLDDENSGTFTAGAITTVSVSLSRKNFVLVDSETVDTLDNVSEFADQNGVCENKIKTPVWMKNKKKSKSIKKVNKKLKIGQTTNEIIEKTSANDNGHSPEVASDDQHVRVDDGTSVTAVQPAAAADSQAAAEEEEREWSRLQQHVRRQTRLQDSTRQAPFVHCPLFPAPLHESWWLYVCDRRTMRLLTVPVHVTDLCEHSQLELQFTNPSRPGVYNFSVCLRSDAYIGFDLQREIKLDVKEAYEIPLEHPQWEISDNDEDKSEPDNDDDIDDFATDDDVEESASD